MILEKTGNSKRRKKEDSERVMRLHINIDHVATLRNQRDAGYPDIVEVARQCMAAGAHGITVHLREDRRHIRDEDVISLKKAALGLLNLEMAATSEMCAFAQEMRPDVVTLVPEKRDERTTEGGLDVEKSQAAVSQVAEMCRKSSIKLSLFIEASRRQVLLSKEIGATQVELHTGHYCEAAESARETYLASIEDAAEYALSLGLDVAAGHGLNTSNVGPIARIRAIQELNIGHSVICEALLVGLPNAVNNLQEAIESARGPTR
jgi:pyridoxine 5-phosphate synthase